MKYFVYMLKSTSTGRHYYGQTNNLDYRLNEHNAGQSPHTKGKGPWNLIGYVECEDYRPESYPHPQSKFINTPLIPALNAHESVPSQEGIY